MTAFSEDGEQSTGLDTAPALVPILALGTSDVPGAVACLGPGLVACVTGRCVAVYSHDPNQQRVSEPCRGVRCITALAASDDRKWLAVAEEMQGNAPPQVSLLHVERGLERSLSLRGPRAERYNALSFSQDGTLVAACSAADTDTSSVFHVWDWGLGPDPASSGTVEGHAVKVTINPKFPSNVVVQCARTLHYLRLSTSGYRQHPIQDLLQGDAAQFVDHVWLADGRLAVACSDQRVLLLEGVALQGCLDLARTPTCLAALPDGGLLVGLIKGGGLGYVDIWKPGAHKAKAKAQRSPGPGGLGLQASLQVPVDSTGPGTGGDGSASGLSVDAQGAHVACYVKQGPLQLLNLQLAQSSALARASGDTLWDLVLPAPHTAAIVSAAFAVRKDMLVTVSDDLTVRVWGWAPSLRLVASHLCHHTPLAVAIDPWGAELVVAYVDSVRLYSVVEGMLLEVGFLRLPSEDGKPGAELVKCSSVAWSPTGHMVVLVGGPGCREVLVFSALHRTLLGRLKGHFSAVQDVSWSADGLYLCSVSDTVVYVWHTETFTRVRECTLKGWVNSSVTCTPDFNTLAVGDSSQGLRIFSSVRLHAPPLPWAAQAGGGGGPQPSGTPPVAAVPTLARKPTAERQLLPGASPSSLAGHKSLAPASSRGPALAPPPGPPASSLAAAAGGLAGGGVEGPAAGAASLTELHLQASLLGIMHPVPGCLVAACSPGSSVLVGAGIMGRLRVAPLPPRSPAHYQEYCLHTSEVRVLRAHYQGRVVLSADDSGCWMLSVLVPDTAFQHAAQVLALSASRHLGRLSASEEADSGRGAGLAPLPPYSQLADLAKGALSRAKVKDGSVDVVMVRRLDMEELQEGLREMRDKLTKAATAADYRVYEKEHEVKKSVEAELVRWRTEVDRLQRELKESQATLTSSQLAAQQELAGLAERYAAGLQEERQRFEARLAVEIERTNASEEEVGRIKAQFGKKLWKLDLSHKQEAATARQQVAVLQGAVASVQQGAANTLDQALSKMESEIQLDSEMNDEEVLRLTAATKVRLQDQEDAYMRLLAKHTLQAGLSNKTKQENEELRRANEQLSKDNTKLSEQVEGLSSELAAMHTAWAERDAKQRRADAELRDLTQQVSQGRMYTSLATGRIQELSSELEPLREGRVAAAEEMARLETVQIRQAERRVKLMTEFDTLRWKLGAAEEELARVKAAARQKEVYFTNFTTQLFRVVHSLPVDKWAGLLGKLHAEYLAGRDKLDWLKYTEPEDRHSEGRVAELTERELRDQLAELQAHVLQVEKQMAVLRGTRAKEQEGQRNTVARLQAENLELLATVNENKRALKAAQQAAAAAGLSGFLPFSNSHASLPRPPAFPAAGPHPPPALGPLHHQAWPQGPGAATAGPMPPRPPGLLPGMPQAWPAGPFSGSSSWTSGQPGPPALPPPSLPGPSVMAIGLAAGAHGRADQGPEDRASGGGGGVKQQLGSRGGPGGWGGAAGGGPDRVVTGERPASGWWLGYTTLMPPATLSGGSTGQEGQQGQGQDPGAASQPSTPSSLSAHPEGGQPAGEQQQEEQLHEAVTELLQRHQHTRGGGSEGGQGHSRPSSQEAQGPGREEGPPVDGPCGADRQSDRGSGVQEAQQREDADPGRHSRPASRQLHREQLVEQSSGQEELPRSHSQSSEGSGYRSARTSSPTAGHFLTHGAASKPGSAKDDAAQAGWPANHPPALAPQASQRAQSSGSAGQQRSKQQPSREGGDSGAASPKRLAAAAALQQQQLTTSRLAQQPMRRGPLAPPPVPPSVLLAAPPPSPGRQLVLGSIVPRPTTLGGGFRAYKPPQ
ncbi:hypothetical protein V8C86DRAFT_3035790 [Haematococcus lacustris]